MTNLDSLETIKKIDTQNVLSSVESLPQQCLHAWEEAGRVSVPEDFKNINKVVMCGMGGSGLAARVIESVFGSELKFPFTRINDYDLPAFTDSQTLVICSSYSGTTEETISNLDQALSKKAKVICIGTGGTLIDKAKTLNLPYYQIQPKYNPSNQPRMAIGYSIVGQLVLAAKAGVINFTSSDLESLVQAMNQIITTAKQDVPQSHNPAKQAANTMKDRVIIYIAANHLVGAIHTVNNQLNENAKNFSADYQIPELNHHLMEGLKHPTNNPDTLLVFFAASDLYSSRIKQRFTITQDVVTKNKLSHFVFTPTSSTKLAQAFELIQFGAFANLYLSLLYNQDPTPIPWVDYFKNQLGQPLGK